MKKNYIYLTILLLSTVLVTLVLSSIYKNEVSGSSFLYERINKITSKEFSEYLTENPDTIIYISSKDNSEHNKFEKRFTKKLEKLNLLENIIYVENDEIDEEIKKSLKDDFNYKYDIEKTPAIIVISEGEVVQVIVVENTSDVNTIINYEVFE